MNLAFSKINKRPPEALSYLVLLLSGLIFLTNFFSFPEIVRVQIFIWATGILPGAVITLLVCKFIDTGDQKSASSIFDLLVHSFSISFFLVTLLCVYTFFCHLSVRYFLWHFYWFWPALGFVLSLSASWKSSIFRETKKGNWIELFTPVSFFLIGLLIAHYLHSPIHSDEEIYHVAYISRIIEVTSLNRESINILVPVKITHPFPITHFIMALVGTLSKASATEAFAFTRGFWSLFSIIPIVAIIRLVTQTSSVRYFAYLGIALSALAGGLFNFSPGIFVNFLFPYSHPSNIAMSVYYTNIFFLVLSCCDTQNRKFSLYVGTLFLFLATTIAFVHLRELIQICVCLTGIFISSILYGERGVIKRRWITRSACLLMLAATITLIYALWYKGYAGTINQMDQEFKATNLKHIKELLFEFNSNLFFSPSQEAKDLFSVPFYGSILLLPLFLYFEKNNILSRSIFFSVLAFLYIFRFKLFTFAYIQATYFEITFTPVRNIFFFLLIIACVTAGQFYQRLSTTGLPRSTLIFWICYITFAGLFPPLANSYSLDPYKKMPIILILFCTFYLVYALFLQRQVKFLVNPLTRFSKYDLVKSWYKNQSYFHQIIHINSHLKKTVTIAVLLGYILFLFWSRWNSPLFDLNSTTGQEPFLRSNIDIAYVKPGFCQDMGKWKNGRIDYIFEPIYACAPPPHFIEKVKDTIGENTVLYGNARNVLPTNFFLGGKLPVWPMANLHNFSDVSFQFKDYFKFIRPYSQSSYWQDPLLEIDSVEEIIRRSDILKIDYLVISPLDFQAVRRRLERFDPSRVTIVDSDWILYDVRIKSFDPRK